MRAVLLEYAEGQHADALRLIDSADEIGGGEFFPVGRELLGRCRQGGSRQDRRDEPESTGSSHCCILSVLLGFHPPRTQPTCALVDMPHLPGIRLLCTRRDWLN